MPLPKDDGAPNTDLGLTAEEAAALAEATAEDAADAATTAADAPGAADVAALADAGKKGVEDDKATADAAAKAAADKADADKVAADKAAADEAGKPEGDAKPVEEEAAQPRQAIPDWQAPADADVKLKEIADKRIALAKKFDDGEITRADEIAEQMTLEAEQRKIERAVDRAQDAADMTTASWLQVTVPGFLDANPHYKTNDTLNGMLDTEVRRLQVAAAKDGKNPLDPSILTKADEAIKASLASMGVKAPAAEAKPADDGKLKPKPGKALIPPTLATIPATDINTDDGGEFAALDRLAASNPAAFEDAYAKLSEAKRNQYLAQG